MKSAEAKANQMEVPTRVEVRDMSQMQVLVCTDL